MTDDPNEWICSHYQRKDFASDDEATLHRACCYVDYPGYWEMSDD